MKLIRFGNPWITLYINPQNNCSMILLITARRYTKWSSTFINLGNDWKKNRRLNEPNFVLWKKLEFFLFFEACVSRMHAIEQIKIFLFREKFIFDSDPKSIYLFIFFKSKNKIDIKWVILYVLRTEKNWWIWVPS